jgi:hypothetical protein
MTPCHRRDSERIRWAWRLKRPEGPSEGPEAAESDTHGVARHRRATLDAPRRAYLGQLPQEQPEVEPADMYEQTLEDVGVSPQMHATHPARLVEMRVGAFQ